MKRRLLKVVSVFMALNLLAEIFFPTAVYALSGGPSQPEVQSFEPVGTTEMVNLSSGDFTYNIPLLDVEGYPINISYHSGITMDQEATWVGLGWNINPGVVNRNMRGLPDDFRGDVVTKNQYVKPNITIGGSFGADYEFIGFKPANISASLGVFYNNYRGVGFEQTITPSLSAGNKLKPRVSLALSGNTSKGLDVSPSIGVSLSANLGKLDGKAISSFSFSVGSSYNSRTGSKALTFSKGYTAISSGLVTKTGKDGNKYVEYASSLSSPTIAGSGGSTLSYNAETYSPQISMPMTGVNMNFSAKYGGTLFGLDVDFMARGYFTSQYIADKDRSIGKGAYGYLYSEDAGNDNLMDVNREKDGGYSKHNPHLPVTNFTHDVYSVNGQGIGGMFRPYRGDVGHIHDDISQSATYGGGGGIELGVGNFIDYGGDINFNYSSSESGLWEGSEGNNLISDFKFRKSVSGNPFYEPSYFKMAGEKNSEETSFMAYKNLGEPLRPVLAAFNNAFGKKFSGNLKGGVLMRSDGEEMGVKKEVAIGQTVRNKRDARTQSIRYLTVADREHCIGGAFMPAYFLNTKYPFTYNSYFLKDRSTIERKNHHISEISVTNGSGSTYVYGIAAYNTHQEEITFTNKHDVNGCATGLAGYDPNYLVYDKGEDDDAHDGYYNRTAMPAFAHSYLLTGVISPDYVDVTGDGLTEDDYGSYTRINYTLASSDYKWRTPIQANKALHSENMKSDVFDDKGSITYGRKEIWHINSIESRNYVAEFTIEERNDGLGVSGRNGGKATNASGKSYLLKKIELYSKAERREKGGSAVPIKTVHFVYDYSLCKNISNTNGTGANSGKLTLKSIFFTYGNTLKGGLNSYNFTYASGARNPDYDVKSYDRWGHYKPNVGCDAFNTEVGYNIPGNAEFPYVWQNKSEADLYSSAWLLDEIKLPSGGTIKVSYESDDYAYVQQKKAMQMTMVKGFSANGTSNPVNQLYQNALGYNWVHVGLTEDCINTTDFIKYYIPDEKGPGEPTRYLFFTMLSYIKGAGGPSEYVRGYAEIEKDGNGQPMVQRLNDRHYSIKVKSVMSGNTQATSYTTNGNPIALAALQHFKLNLPQYVYPASSMKKNPTPGIASIKALLGIFFDIYDLATGVNDRMLSNGFGKYTVLGKCWVRLNNATGYKYGGGVRVKRLEMTDAGTNMSLPDGESTYGQEYEYTTTDNGRTISSGVASYEPMVGGDENPFRQPIVSKKENALIPDESFYSEEPMGESFFPSPGVVYSKVTVRNLSRVNVTKHATGKVVNEFYTTRDFPTLVSRTNSQASVIKPNWLGGLLSFRTFNQVSAVQGYQIELNDMDGRPKAEWVYAENIENPSQEGKLISGMQYFYKTDPDNPNHLNNNVKVVSADGLVNESADVLVGVESDMILDTRSEESRSGSYGLELNSNLVIPGWFLLKFGVPIPSYNGDVTRFRSAVVTRVIQRYGLLTKTIAYTDNATITTQNVAYDANTGEVLIAQLHNEYHDPVYTASYPAYWAFKGMGPAYLNQDLVLTGASVTHDPTGTKATLSLPDIKNKLFPGDILLLNDGTTTAKVRLEDDNSIVFPSALVGKSLPVVIPGVMNNCSVRVLVSGRRNMMLTEGQSLSTKQLPIVNVSGGGKSITQLDASVQVLTTKGSEFGLKWRTYSNWAMNPIPDSVEIVPSDIPALFTYMFKNGNLTNSSNQTPFALAYNAALSSEYNQLVQGFIYGGSNNMTKMSYRTNYQLVNGKQYWVVQLASTVNSQYYDYNGTLFELEVSTAPSCAGLTAIPTAITYSANSISFDSYYIEGTIGVDVHFAGCTAPVPGVIRLSNLVTSPSHRNARYIYGQEQCLTVKGNRLPYPNWRKVRDYAYLDNRVPADNTNTNIRKDGYYTSYQPLYVPASNNDAWTNWNVATLTPRWTWSALTTNYSPEGDELENVDPLNRYNSVLFQPNRLPEAVASNAQYREIAYEGAEWSDYVMGSSQCTNKGHWRFNELGHGGFSVVSNLNAILDNTVSHTGKRSFKLNNDIPATANTYFIRGCDNYLGSGQTCNDYILPFSPYTGKDYLISGWVKVNTSASNVENYDASVLVKFRPNSLGTIITIKPSGAIIDGWQRFEAKFVVPALASAIEVVLNKAPGYDTWYDDIRICPNNANMKSFVYDQTTLRVMAELDENNYATYYEYDAQGALKRVKKETEKGVMTIKESRNHQSK